MLVSALTLGGCQTDAAPSATNTSTSSTTTSTTTTPTTTTPTTPVVPATTYTMTLVPALTTLSAGGTTAVTATILANGVVDTSQVVSVTFTSSCTAQGKATMTSPVVSSAGVAVSSYKDTNCGTTDTLGASASVGGSTISASASLTVQAAAMGSIQFIGATPANIGIKGVGLTETSAVQFQVKDVNGQPAPAGQSVNFSLDTTTGGITFNPTSATTDASGYVTTNVTSGTYPATVRVTATLASNTTIKSQSSGLVISTGISDQNSFSLSADILNPEGWSYDGETVKITVRASDHFNNPVPDGASVLFTANGGQIQPSCTITAGACTVTWTSSNPRPAKGRVVILANMTGEESFTDLNGNNRFDDTEPFIDLPEAWVDANENGVYDAGMEEFRDFNGNGIYTGGDGKYNGVLCAGPTLCGTTKSVDTRGSITLVMSESFFTVSVSPSPISAAVNNTYTGTMTICGEFNNQLPPLNTQIAVSSDFGTAALIGSGKVPTGNTNGCFNQPFTFKPGATPGSGTLTITVTTPKGNATNVGPTVTGY